jgi:hypothetical protein
MHFPERAVDRELANDGDRYGRLIDDNRYDIGFSI